MNDYPFNIMMKVQLESYFERMRYRVKCAQFDIYWSIKDEFNGYIRALCAAEVIDQELKDYLFHIAGDMWKLYRDKGVC